MSLPGAAAILGQLEKVLGPILRTGRASRMRGAAAKGPISSSSGNKDRVWWESAAKSVTISGENLLATRTGNSDDYAAVYGSAVWSEGTHTFTAMITSEIGHLTVGILDASKPLAMESGSGARYWGLFPKRSAIISMGDAFQIGNVGSGTPILATVDCEAPFQQTPITVTINMATKELGISIANGPVTTLVVDSLPATVRPFAQMRGYRGDKIELCSVPSTLSDASSDAATCVRRAWVAVAQRSGLLTQVLAAAKAK